MSVWKDRNRGYWRFEFQYNKEFYRGGGYGTRREAVTAQEEKRRSVIEDHKQKIKTATDMDFLELANTYLDYGQRRFATSTYQDKVRIYKLFAKHSGSLSVYEITPRIVLDYLNQRPSANNFNVHRKEISAVFNYGIKVLQLKISNPCTPIEKLPHTPEDKRPISEQEFLQIMAAADPKTDEQDLLLVIAMSLARVDEILRLKWTDVDFDADTLTKWTRKRKGGAYEAIIVPMSPMLADLLKRRWKARKQDLWVFYNEEEETRYMHRPKLMAAVCKRAGIKPLGVTMRNKGKWDKVAKKHVYRNVQPVEEPVYYGFHSIRHFMATYLHQKNKVMTSVIQELLGHKDERTTKIYVHVLPRNVKEAVDQIDDLFAPENKVSDKAEN